MVEPERATEKDQSGRTQAVRHEVWIATMWGLIVTLLLAAAIVVGSRNLSRFDSALVAYTFASLFAAFGITYRYSMWLQRPPTAMYWRRGWEAFFKRPYRKQNAVNWFRRVISDFGLNRFIWLRGKYRWLAHWLIMWGCIIAALITFPLVFGWIMFESVPGDLNSYRIYLFGFPTTAFKVESVFGFILFHGLVWAALLVIPGVMIAMHRRMRDEGAASLQVFREDILPLVLLFAVSLTGLLLTVSATWLHGYGYEFMAITHAATVIVTLLWLPFGKFFHIFQRPAQIGVSFYKDVARAEEAAKCRRCGHAFSSRMHVEDLIRVQRELGYRYEANGEVGHYQWICPRCRRALLALAQGKLRFSRASTVAAAVLPAAMPVPVNPGLGEGPLDVEDRENFHP
jgi:hypothetical protein